MPLGISQRNVDYRFTRAIPTFKEGLAQVTENSHWFIVQLKPNGFERAKKNFARQHFKTFMPMQEISINRRGRLTETTRPLFPGYLFVQISPTMPDWRAVNNTYGVSRLVSLGDGRPTEVRSDLMSALRMSCDIECRLRAPEDLAVGKKVRIVVGPFSQHIAEIEAVAPGERVILLMQLMGRLVRTEVEPGALEIL